MTVSLAVTVFYVQTKFVRNGVASTFRTRRAPSLRTAQRWARAARLAGEVASILKVRE